jgi:uncharacterized protein (TIGR03067 family)
MRRIVCWLVCALLVLPLLGSDLPKEYDGATRDTELEGSWRQVGAIWNGGVTEGMEREYVWTYHNGKETTHLDGDLIAQRPFTVRASFRPGRMDCFETVGEHKGKTWRHIYRIEGDTLWIAHGPVDGERPRGFESANVYVGIYKRVK